MDFKNKKVLVTGGARGIGKAIAVSFAARGAKVMLAYRQNHAAAQESKALLEGEGHAVFAGDLLDPSVCKDLIKTTIASLGGLDILVNNAGIFEAHPIDAVDYEDWQARWQHTLAVNLLAPANLAYLAAQTMMAQKSGHIVNVGSRGAFRGEPECPAYGASKAGLHAMSQSLAQKLAPYNITVGAVAPGFVETDMASVVLDTPRGQEIRNQSPFGRVAKPEEVAHAVLFLASEEAIFSTGAIIDVNGASYLRT